MISIHGCVYVCLFMCALVIVFVDLQDYML